MEVILKIKLIKDSNKYHSNNQVTIMKLYIFYFSFLLKILRNNKINQNSETGDN